jgi:hypothetical protein
MLATVGHGNMALHEIQPAHSRLRSGAVQCRNHHFVADGSFQDGCLRGAIAPVELFFVAVAACGVEFKQVVAREQNLLLRGASSGTFGVIDLMHPTRQECSI